VEYTFKNSASEKATTAVLNDYNLTLQQGDRVTVIPYANITSVRLTRTSVVYKTLVKTEGRPPFIITNNFFITSKDREDRSPQYATFVRVLHFHMKDKSASHYTCGNDLKSLMYGSCALVILAFLISFLLEFLQLSPINYLVFAVLTSLVLVSFVVLLNWGRFPNMYKPESIPLQFLP